MLLDASALASVSVPQSALLNMLLELQIEGGRFRDGAQRVEEILELLRFLLVRRVDALIRRHRAEQSVHAARVVEVQVPRPVLQPKDVNFAKMQKGHILKTVRISTKLLNENHFLVPIAPCCDNHNYFSMTNIHFSMELIDFRMKIIEFLMNIVAFSMKLINFRMKIIEFLTNIVDFSMKITDFLEKILR